MEEFETSSRVEIGNGGVRDKFRHLELGMEEFERSSILESEMEEFETSSDAWNREWKSSSSVRGFESEIEEFEPSSDAWNREWRSSS